MELIIAGMLVGAGVAFLMFFRTLKKPKINEWKELYLEMYQTRDRLMKNVIEVRVTLYSMFPEKITDISNLFQRYDLE